MKRLVHAMPLAIVLAACASAQKPADAGPPLRGDFRGPLGVQLYTFRDAFRGGEGPATLARVRSLGFKEVELAGSYGMNAQRFRETLDAAGLRATSMHMGYEMFRDSLQSVLAQAKTLGASYVGTAWIPHPNGPMTVDLARRTAADFNAW